MKPALTLLALLWIAALPAVAIPITLTNLNSAESTVTVQQPANVLPEMVAFESMGAVLENRIEFRYSPLLTLQVSSLESGWSYQSLVATEGLQQVGLSTFYFSGFDSQNNFEYHSFYDPWTATFSFTDTNGQEVTEETPLHVDVFASAMLIGSGRIAASGDVALVHNSTTVAVPDHGGTLLLASCSLGLIFLAAPILNQRRAKTSPLLSAS